MTPLWFWEEPQVPWYAAYDNYGRMVFYIWPWRG